jgi:uncharacterized linocin/CFP29 family protein
MNQNNLGREKLPWREDRWTLLDQAVHDEAMRTRIGRRFIPCVPLADVLTAPADTVVDDDGLLLVNEAAVTPLIELWVEFALTKQQVEAEAELSTTVTLATRAANLLSQGEDLLLFQGQDATKNDPLFLTGRVHFRAGPGPDGLTDLQSVDPSQVIPVEFSEAEAGRYGENTFAQVALGYATLQDKGHYGPYALVLPTIPYADTYAPLKTTLIMPADRIMPLVENRFYGSGTLPDFVGVLLSLGGNTLDLVVGRDAVIAFVQEDQEGLYRFRVYERFALRDKNREARILLKFEAPPAPDQNAAAT